jgi:hypothetical protein
MQNQVDKQFLARTKVVDFFIAAVEFAAWKFLAITTGILSYSLFDSFIQDNLPEQYLMAGRIVGVTLMFLLIDAGLDKMIAFWIEENAEAEKEKEDDSKLVKFQKSFLRNVFWLVVIRFLLTATSSFWAAPAVGELITKDNEAGSYVSMIKDLDTKDSLDMAKAEALLAEAKATESSRLKAANRQAGQIWKDAYNKGDRWQRQSYDKEGHAWLSNSANKDQKDHAYSKSLKDARKQGEQVIAAEKNKVALLEATITGNDPVSDSLRLKYSNLAISADQTYTSTLSVNTGIVFLFDFAAAALGIVCTSIRVRRRLAAGVKQNKKNFLSLFGILLEQINTGILNFFEKVLNVDIDGDGLIAGEGTVMAAASSPTTSQSQPINNGSIDVQQVVQETIKAITARPVVKGFRQSEKVPESSFSDDFGSARSAEHVQPETFEIQDVQPETFSTEQVVHSDEFNPIVIKSVSDLGPLKQHARNYWRRANEKKRGEDDDPKTKQAAIAYRAKKRREFEHVKKALAPYYKIIEVSATSIRFEDIKS